jgi:hypothetical protein
VDSLTCIVNPAVISVSVQSLQVVESVIKSDRYRLGNDKDMAECRVCRISVFLGVKEGYLSMTMKEIRREARRLGIPARPVLSKKDLLDAIITEYEKQYPDDYYSCLRAYRVDEDFFPTAHDTDLKYEVLPWRE